MMEARLAELSPFVDVFVVVEAGRTHQGLQSVKFEAALEGAIRPLAHKVVHVWVDFDFLSIWPWVCENYQREGFWMASCEPASSR